MKPMYALRINIYTFYTYTLFLYDLYKKKLKVENLNRAHHFTHQNDSNDFVM